MVEGFGSRRAIVAADAALRQLSNGSCWRWGCEVQEAGHRCCRRGMLPQPTSAGTPFDWLLIGSTLDAARSVATRCRTVQQGLAESIDRVVMHARRQQPPGEREVRVPEGGGASSSSRSAEPDPREALGCPHGVVVDEVSRCSPSTPLDPSLPPPAYPGAAESQDPVGRGQSGQSDRCRQDAREGRAHD